MRLDHIVPAEIVEAANKHGEQKNLLLDEIIAAARQDPMFEHMNRFAEMLAKHDPDALARKPQMEVLLEGFVDDGKPIKTFVYATALGYQASTIESLVARAYKKEGSSESRKNAELLWPGITE